MVVNYDSNAKIQFGKKSYDIYQIFELHDELTKSKFNLIREKQKFIINSTYIMITACWQTYIENLCKESFIFLMKNFKSKSKNWIEPVLLEKKLELLKRFNTPKADEIKNLFYKVLNIDNTCKYWRWKTFDCDGTKGQLGNRITIRGQLAHTNTTPNTLSKSTAEEYLDLIVTLVNQTEKAMQEYIKSLTNKNLGKKVI